MKHLYTTVILILFSLPVVAQETFDYMLFRPGAQYLYPNLVPGTLDFFEAPSSELLGIKIEPTEIDSLGRYPLYQMPAFYRTSYCYTLRPSFAGTSIHFAPDSTTMYFDGDNSSSSLLIIHSAGIGTSWSAAPGIVGQVDSITEGTYRERPTTIKYISLLDSTSNELLAIVPISRKFGLLAATDYYLLGSREQWSSPLLSTSQPALGPQLPSSEDIFNIPIGTQLSVGRVLSVVLQNHWYFQHTYRNLTVERVRPDSVQTGFEIDLTYDENAYRIAPEEGDSIYNVQRTYAQSTTWTTRHRPINELNHQPGAAIITEHATGESLSVARAGYLGASCFGIGRGLQDLGYQRAGTEPSCFYPPTDNENSGLYFANASGPYGYLGSFSYHDVLLGRVQNEAIDCGEPYDLTVATRRLLPDLRISVYPNPATKQVTIEIPDDLGPVSLRLISTDGRLVRSLDGGRGNQTVSLGDLPAGVYTVVVAKDGSLVGRRRLVVK